MVRILQYRDAFYENPAQRNGLSTECKLAARTRQNKHKTFVDLFEDLSKKEQKLYA